MNLQGPGAVGPRPADQSVVSNDSPDAIRVAKLADLLDVDTVEATQRLIEQSPQLLDDRTDTLIQSLLHEFAVGPPLKEEDPSGERSAITQRKLRRALALVRRCREAGLSKAFQE